MLDLIGVFMIITVFSFAGSLLFRHRFEYILPLTMFSIILTAYLMAAFGLLKWLSTIMIVLFLISLVYILGHFISNRTSRRKSLRLLFTFGFILFFIISSVLIVYNYGRMFTLWDEFTHWGLTAKNMFALDSFAIGDKANTVFQDYPPAMALFQYFFSLFDRVFIEAHVIQASAVFSIGLLLAMFPRRREEYWTIFPIVIGFFGLCILLFYPHHFDQVYVDGILAILFAYVFLRVIDPSPMDRFRIIEITLGTMVLTLVKSSGFFLAILAIVAMLLPFNIKRIKYAVIPFAGVLLAKISWAWIVKDIGTHFDVTKISVVDIIDFLIGKGGFRYATVTRFFSAFILNPMTLTGRVMSVFGFSLSYLGYAILLSLLLILISRKLNVDDKKRSNFIAAFLFISFMAYTFSLLFMYLFNFSEYEAIRIASFSRYIGTFALTFTLIYIVLFADIYAGFAHKALVKVHSRKYATLLLIIFMLGLGVLAYPRVKSKLLSWQVTQGARAPYSQIEAYRGILKPEDRIYLICQHSQGYDYWILRYNLTPSLTQNGFGSWSLGGKYEESDVWFRNISIQDWKLELTSNYEYVYLFVVDDRFKSMYGALFSSMQEIKNRSLYQVSISDEGPILHLVDIKK